MAIIKVKTGGITADAITSTEIADNAVVTAAINADAVTDAKIADDVVGTEHLTANEVDTAALGADAVTGAQLADDAVNSEHYTDGSVDTAHIADANVTQGKIADQAINEAKMQISNAPTNGYMLTAQSGNTGGLTWAAAGGGAWNVISSGTASGSTSIDFTSIATTYDHYALIITDLRPADQSNAHVLIQIKNDNNGSFKTSSYATHASRLSASSDSYDGKGETSTSGVEIANAMEDNASYGCSAVVYFPNLTESGYQKILSQSQYKSNAHKGGTTFGIYTSVTDPIDGIRIKFANQNITSGKATLYGIANT